MEAADRASDNEGEKAVPSESFRVDANDASALLDILVSRGYFHADVSPLQSNAVEFGTTATATNHSAEECLLIATNDNCHVMLDTLQHLLAEALRIRGRLSIDEACNVTNVSADLLLRRVVPRILESTEATPYIVSSSTGVVKEIVSAEYVRDATDKLRLQLHQAPESGSMPLNDVAISIFQLPLDMTLSIVQDNLAVLCQPSEAHLLLNENGSKVLVTECYLKHLKDQICECLTAHDTAPVVVKAICKERGWDHSWMLRFIKDRSLSSLPGEFHGETYVPANYTESKRRSVLESFSTNGFVTSQMCHALFGISPSQMKEFVVPAATASEEVKSSRLVLANSIVHRDSIVAPLVEAALEAAESASWLDLQLHVPVEMLEHETEDVRALMEQVVLPEAPGRAFVEPVGALYFSEAMITSFRNDKLPTLIKTLAASSASDLFKAESERIVNDDGMDHDGHVSGKEKRRTRHASKTKQSDTATAAPVVKCDEVSLDVVLQLLLECHPDLDSTEIPRQVVLGVCDLSLDMEELQAACDAEARVELERLRLEAKQSVRTDQPALGGSVQNAEAAFEDGACFATLCYMVQSKAKFLSYALEHIDPADGAMKAFLERDFLSTCCAEFTSRVTQYALLKNHVDDGIFSFRRQQKDNVPFFHPVDLAAASFDRVYLSCVVEKVGQRHDALALLREELPSVSGVALARQWILVGGECYQGGVKQVTASNDDRDRNEVYTRPGDVSGFLSHVRENCLAICGMPFTNLDKKAEKKFLNSRRVALAQRLEGATDAGTALDLRIMLQYLLAKNMVVSGPLLRGQVLQLLLQERKVPESVAHVLNQVAEKLLRNEQVDDELVERLKDTSSTKE